MEEIIVKEFEVPKEYITKLAKALLMKDVDSIDAICGIVEEIHYKIPDSQKFFSAAAGIVASLPEKKCELFKLKMQEETERPEVPARVQMFYRCMI